MSPESQAPGQPPEIGGSLLYPPVMRRGVAPRSTVSGSAETRRRAFRDSAENQREIRQEPGSRFLTCAPRTVDSIDDHWSFPPSPGEPGEQVLHLFLTRDDTSMHTEFPKAPARRFAPATRRATAATVAEVATLTAGTLAIAFLTTLVTAFLISAQQAPDPSAYTALEWRHIGPEGNRFSAAAGIPGDPHTYYVGAASGGIYKTTDGGVHWDAIFDDQPVQSIGSLGVAMADPNIVWAGTGEGKIRSHISVGQGVYKSTDAGTTWTLMGLEQTGRIPRLVIHPTNPDIVYICALGHAYGPQPERGVFRTMDGGASWEQVLFVDEDTGCSDIAMDPSNSRVLFAGTWQLEIHTWGRTSGGPGGGLHVSRDGGDTWTKLNGPDNGIGLPEKPVGKVAVAVAPSNPDRVYAMLETGDGIPWEGRETEDGQLWRSEDGGRDWSLVTRNRNAMGRPHYYSRVVVSPNDEDEAYFLTASFTTSTDGGRTLDVTPRPRAPGGDHHDMWIDHTDPDRMIVAHDQGLSISINRGKTWFRQRLTNAQMYHVTVDNAIPYNVLGNKQDEPTYRGPSNSRIQGQRRINGIPRGMWHHVGGGESGWATPDPTDPNIVWSSASGSGMVGGIVVRYEEERRQYRGVEVWPEQSRGAASGVRYRFVWDAPIHISPHDNNTVYVGSQHVHRTRNGGQSWEAISPDLTLNDQSRMGALGGADGGQHRGGVRGCGLRDRRVAGGTRADLGRDERRAAACDPRRGTHVDERDGQHAGPAGVDGGSVDRGIPLRRGNGLCGH